MTVCTQCGDQHNPSDARCPRTGGQIQAGGPCGSMIDRYRVERLLGQGGMGSVYLARHSALGQQVALKLLRPELAADGHIGGRFLREAQAAAAIQHPHIVRVSDFGTVPSGEAFLVMELLAGHDLDKLLERVGPLPLPRAMHIILQVLDALSAAHAAGVVHRDMKPANVFLVQGPNGDPDTVKLVDFGISKVRNTSDSQGGAKGNSLTRTGMAIGTPAYMPPEQIFGAKTLDHRADIYATAVMLFEMLTTRRPYEAESYETLILQVVSQPPRHVCDFIPQLPRAVGDVIVKGMAREPDHRFSSAREFADALRQVTAGVSAPVPMAAPMHSAPPTGQPWQAGAMPTPTPAPAPGYPGQPSTPPPGYGMTPAPHYGASPTPAPHSSDMQSNPNAPHGYPPTMSSTGAPVQVTPTASNRTGLFVALGLVAGGAIAGSLWMLMRKPPAPPVVAQAPKSTGPALPTPPGNTDADPNADTDDDGETDAPVAVVPGVKPPTQLGSVPANTDDDGDTEEDGDTDQLNALQGQAIAAQVQAQIAAAQLQALNAGLKPPSGVSDAGDPSLVIPPPGTGVRIGEPDIVGHGNVLLVKRRLEAIRGTMEDCRVAGQTIKASLTLFCQGNGGVSIVQEGDENQADEDTTKCLVNRVKTYYGQVPGNPQGILTIGITLTAL